MELSLEQLEKLEANPNYKLSQKQQARLAQLRSGRFKNNPNFVIHPTKVINKASELTDGKTTDNN